MASMNKGLSSVLGIFLSVVGGATVGYGERSSCAQASIRDHPLVGCRQEVCTTDAPFTRSGVGPVPLLRSGQPPAAMPSESSAVATWFTFLFVRSLVTFSGTTEKREGGASRDLGPLVPRLAAGKPRSARQEALPAITWGRFALRRSHRCQDLRGHIVALSRFQ